MQFSPRLTGANGSPFEATILPSFVATIIPQPVPQKRQTALSQRQPASAFFAALAGLAIPAAPHAAATAELFINSRLSIFSSLEH